MYKVKYWDSTEVLRTRLFASLDEAIRFSVYGPVPFRGLYGIDLIKD
jgi:hypothetical protein